MLEEGFSRTPMDADRRTLKHQRVNKETAADVKKRRIKRRMDDAVENKEDKAIERGEL